MASQFRDSEGALFRARTKGSKAGKIYYSKAAADRAVGKMFSQGWHEAYIVDLGGGRYRVVKRPGSSSNPASLPIGKFVTVKAKRLKNGRIELYRA